MNSSEITTLEEHREIVLLDVEGNLHIARFISEDSDQVHRRRLADIIANPHIFPIEQATTINLQDPSKTRVISKTPNIPRHTVIFGFESKAYLDALYMGDLQSKLDFWQKPCNLEYMVSLSLQGNYLLQGKTYNVDDWLELSKNDHECFVTIFGANVCPIKPFQDYLKKESNIFAVNLRKINQIRKIPTYAHMPKKIELFDVPIENILRNYPLD